MFMFVEPPRPARCYCVLHRRDFSHLVFQRWKLRLRELKQLVRGTQSWNGMAGLGLDPGPTPVLFSGISQWGAIDILCRIAPHGARSLAG